MKKIIILYLFGIILLSSFTNAALSDGLVAYYSMDGGSTTGLLNSVPNGVNITKVGNPTYNTNGKIGGSWTVTGTGTSATPTDRLYINFINPINSATNSWTISVWQNFPSTFTSDKTIFWFGTMSGSIEVITMQLFTRYSIQSFDLLTNDGVGHEIHTPLVTPTKNEWVHMVYINNQQNNMTVYMNGQMVATLKGTTIPIVSPTSFNFLGRNNVNVASYSSAGNFGYDELGFWNRTLTPEEIQTLYNNGSGITYDIIAYNPSVYFVFPTPSNNIVQYIDKNFLLINVSTNIQNPNITINFYNSTNNLLFTNSSLSNITYLNVSGLEAGVYYFNATAKNSTHSFNTETRKITIYKIINGSIVNPSFNQNVSRSLNIVWNNASTTNNSVAISNYTIRILNNDNSVNLTLGTFTTNNVSWNIYPFNLSVGYYKVNVQVNDVNGNNINSTQPFILIRDALLNVTAYDFSTNASISNLNVRISNLNDTGIEYWNTTGTNLLIDIIKGKTYEIFFDVQNYAFSYINYTSNQSSSQKLNNSLFKTNSVQIYVYDESNLNLITLPTNITFISNFSSMMYNTTTGYLFVSNITPGFYEVKAKAPTYAQRSYHITVTDRSTQNLNIYLTQSELSLLLTYIDTETGELIDGCGVVVSKLVNGSWNTIASGITDITGRVQFSVSTNTNYRFSSSCNGYEDKTFNLNPIIFTSYTIKLTKTQSLKDLNSVNVYVYNTTFTNNGTNSFIWQISAPLGNLESYGYTLTTPCKNITSFNGFNAYGDIDYLSFNLTCASVLDPLILRFNYTIVNGDTETFTYTYPIKGFVQTNAFTDNQQEHYGMGLFERILITVLITLLFAGLVAKFSNIVAGLVAGLLILSYLSYIGFVEWWVIAPTLLVGVILLMYWLKRF